jgi:predicted dehydrogenase
MKVIQVGIGGMGQVWLQTVLASEEVEFAGFVEVNEGIAEAQAARNGLDRALIFPTLDDALASVQADGVDGVINVTPPQFHRDISIRALEAGIPVLSEKPLAPTLAEAREIVECANRTGVLHVVTQNYRYSTVAQTLKRALDPVGMGKIGAVTVEFFKGPHFGGFREEMPYPLIVDMSIHHFDLLRFFLGADPVSVFGRSWNPSWSWFKGDASASALVNFEDGVVATYSGSWCATGHETPWNGNWRFDCENGIVTLVDDKVWVYPRVREHAGLLPPPVEPTPVELVAPPRVAQAYLLHEFYAAVTEGAPAVTTCQDNIKSLSIVLNLVESFERGGVVGM